MDISPAEVLALKELRRWRAWRVQRRQNTARGRGGFSCHWVDERGAVCVMNVGGTKRQRMAHDGFFYTQDYDGTGGKKYFKCSLKSSKKCKGRGIMDNGVFRPSKPHNHAPNVATIERAVARATMRKRAEETMEPVQEIRRVAEADMSACAREEMPMAPEVSRAVNRYRAGARDGRAQPRDADDVNLAGFTETVGRPGTPPERFLLYDSQLDAEYAGKRMLLFSSDWGLDQLYIHLSGLGSRWNIQSVPRYLLSTLHCTRQRDGLRRSVRICPAERENGSGVPADAQSGQTGDSEATPRLPGARHDHY